MFYTYIIKSLNTGRFYIGSTLNLSDRLLRHNGNRERYTKNKGPWILVLSEEFATRSEAYQKELYLKSIKNKIYLQSIINKWRGGSSTG